MSVISGALGHVLWGGGEAEEPAKLFPIRVTAVDEITATFDCEHLACRGSCSKDLPFADFILNDPDRHVGVGSTSQVQPVVPSFEAVPTGLPKLWVDKDGRELKVGAMLATCEDSSGKPVAAVIKAEIAKLIGANLERGMPGTNRGPSGQGDRAAINGRLRCTHGMPACAAPRSLGKLAPGGHVPPKLVEEAKGATRDSAAWHAVRQGRATESSAHAIGGLATSIMTLFSAHLGDAHTLNLPSSGGVDAMKRAVDAMMDRGIPVAAAMSSL